jgi:aspartyl-tRNA synthetase
MERSHVSELKTGKSVLLKGWIHEVRRLSGMTFLLLRDSSGIVQCIIKDKKISDMTLESVVEITGKVKKAKVRAEIARHDIEVKVSDLKVLSKAEDLPIQVHEKTIKTSLPTRLDYRWLDLRKPKHLLIFKIWTCMEDAMREYWLKNGFIQIHTPKFMGSASESGAELFNVDYFGKKVYLAQSPQFYKQMAMAAGFEKVFEIAPVFRANPSDTSRHDTEFTMIDMEVSFIDSEEDFMKIEEEWIVYFLKKVKVKFGKEIKKTFGVDIVIPKLPFPRVTMKEALEMLRKKSYKSPKGKDLDAEGEKLLYELIKKKYNHEFVFVKEYPVSVRPFYHMRKENDKSLTKGFDLIWKGVEITTGAQREHRSEILKKQAIEKGMDLKSVQYYIDFFRYGCPPHAGGALSPSRLLMLMLNLGNVREATFLPRDIKRTKP